MDKRILLFFIHPLGFTVIIGLVIILFLPKISKYTIKQISKGKDIPTTTTAFYDLDNDGTSEMIKFENTPTIPSVLVLKDDKIIDQWELEGEFVFNDFYFFTDYDNDGLNEIYTITLFNDSLYINGIDPITERSNSVFFHKFLDVYHNSKIGKDCDVFFCKATDLNNDGYKELIFTITTGYSTYPRKFYAVDIKNNSVISSQEGCIPLLNPIACDINNDGFDEFIANNYAFGNCSDTIEHPFNDWSGWFVVFDRFLHYSFCPKKVGGYMTQSKILPYKTKNKTNLICLITNPGLGRSKNKMIMFTSDGKVIKERYLLGELEQGEGFLINNKSLIYNNSFILFKNGYLEQIDSDLNVVRTIKIPGADLNIPSELDVDNDGQSEFIFSANSWQGWIITRHDFTDPIEIQTANDSFSPHFISLILRKGSNPYFFIESGSNYSTFEYSKNPFHTYQILLYLGIFLILYVIIYLISKFQKIRLQHKYETEKKIAEYQLKSIKNRVDPHFTLNLMNSIGGLYYREDSKNASIIIGKYGKLLRSIILSSDNIEISLETELEDVRNYLDLEKLRMNNQFDYSIIIDDDVRLTESIPKMVIFNFVENSVKHGIKHKIGNGKIEIKIIKTNSNICITVEDNGVGRKQAAEYSEHSTGMGNEITDKILSLYKDLKRIKICYQITDLMDENNNPSGTLVKIFIPVL